jgi:hypothetical protein
VDKEQPDPDARWVNHDGQDYCIMSGDGNDEDNSVEFDVDCLYDVRGEQDPI